MTAKRSHPAQRDPTAQARDSHRWRIQRDAYGLTIFRALGEYRSSPISVSGATLLMVLGWKIISQVKHEEVGTFFLEVHRSVDSEPEKTNTKQFSQIPNCCNWLLEIWYQIQRPGTFQLGKYPAAKQNSKVSHRCIHWCNIKYTFPHLNSQYTVPSICLL